LKIIWFKNTNSSKFNERLVNWSKLFRFSLRYITPLSVNKSLKIIKNTNNSVNYESILRERWVNDFIILIFSLISRTALSFTSELKWINNDYSIYSMRNYSNKWSERTFNCFKHFILWLRILAPSFLKLGLKILNSNSGNIYWFDISEKLVSCFKPFRFSHRILNPLSVIFPQLKKKVNLEWELTIYLLRQN